MKELKQLIKHLEIFMPDDKIEDRMEITNLETKHILKYSISFNDRVILMEEYEFDNAVKDSEKLMLDKIRDQIMLAGFVKYKEMADDIEKHFQK